MPQQNEGETVNRASSTGSLKPKKTYLIPKTIDNYTFEQEVNDLCFNEYGRYLTNSDKVGHVLVKTNKDNHEFFQYTLANGQALNTPEFVTVKNISLNQRYGATVIQAKSADGTDMLGKRFIDISVSDCNDKTPIKYRMYSLSPTKNHMWKNKIWYGGQNANVKIFNDNKEVQKDLREATSITKKHVWDIDRNSLVPRDEIETRIPSQNKVMGKSAIDEFKDYADMYEDALTTDAKIIFDKAEKARQYYRSSQNQYFTRLSNHRPEWLHAKGFGLTPMNQDPQKDDNLCAAPKRENTRMLRGERTAKNLLRAEGVKASGDVEFIQVVNSDIMEKGSVNFHITKMNNAGEDERKITISQELFPFKKYPDDPKASDVYQTTVVARNLLCAKPFATSEKNGEATQGLIPQPNIEIDTPLTNFIKLKHGNERHSNSPSTNKDVDMNDEIKLRNNSIDIERSVVKVEVQILEKNFSEPWQGSSPLSGNGSGVIVRIDDQVYIMTNAHVIDDTIRSSVRFANTNYKYKTEIIVVGNKRDLALLKLRDSEPKAKEFLEKAIPVEIGDMVALQDEVSVVGFPMLGTEVSHTNGTVNRVLVSDYVQGDEDNLQVQTQAPINSGNSGGPVFSNGKLVGIAFQGCDFGDGFNYFIPVPVINHFLKDFALNGNKVKGCPEVEFDYQLIENDYMRKAYSLESTEFGILVNKIDKLSCAHDKLLPKDVILKIDGVDITSDGMCNVPGVKRIDFNYLFKRKQVGETCVFTVSRFSPGVNKYTEQEVEVKLTNVYRDTKIIKATEFNSNPEFFIESGLVFQKLCKAYFDNGRGMSLFGMIPEFEDSLLDKSSDDPEKSYVVISNVLHSEYTDGYKDMTNKIIKSINGQEIRNIEDANNKIKSVKIGENICVELFNGSQILIPRLTFNQNSIILSENNVHARNSFGLSLKPAPLIHSRNDGVYFASNSRTQSIDIDSSSTNGIYESDMESSDDIRETNLTQNERAELDKAISYVRENAAKISQSHQEGPVLKKQKHDHSHAEEEMICESSDEELEVVTTTLRRSSRLKPKM